MTVGRATIRDLVRGLQEKSLAENGALLSGRLLSSIAGLPIGSANRYITDLYDGYEGWVLERTGRRRWVKFNAPKTKRFVTEGSRRYPRDHVLYRFWNSDGALLYIGITSERGGDRFDQHQTDRPWWPEVVGITLERFASREELVRAEREAVRCEHPTYNSQLNRW